MILDEILIFSGAAFILISAIGVLRFGDPLSRMHATTKASSFGILLIIIGVCLAFGHWLVYVKALLIIVFIYLTAPLAAHAIARSIHPEEGKDQEKEA